MSEPNLFSTADCLKSSNNRGYGRLPIPQPRDAEIGALLERWASLDAPARRTAAQQLALEQRDVLLAYSERMATMAVRHGDDELILLGLLALGADNLELGDERDSLLIVPLHNDAALRIGADPVAIFERAAALLPEESASVLKSFPQRPDDTKTIQSMGYIASADADGFRYMRTW